MPAGLEMLMTMGALTVVSAIESFFVARAPRKESAHTQAAYRRDLVEVATLAAAAAGIELSALTVDQLTGPLLRTAFAHFAEPRSAASVARAWSTWNQFFHFLVADGIAGGNPMPAVERPRIRRRGPKPLGGEDTPEQLLQAVLSGARKARDPWPERDLVVLSLGLLAGLRLSEMLGLRLDSVAGRPGERRLQVLGKGDKIRSVPFEPALEHLIALYLETRLRRFDQRTLPRNAPLLVDTRGRALQRGGAQYLVRQCYRHAGIHDRVPRGALVHALRHTFATRLAEDGATASEIMTLLGHASITTSQNYIDATAREQRQAIRSNRTYRTLEQLLSPAD